MVIEVEIYIYKIGKKFKLERKIIIIYLVFVKLRGKFGIIIDKYYIIFFLIIFCKNIDIIICIIRNKYVIKVRIFIINWLRYLLLICKNLN